MNNDRNKNISLDRNNQEESCYDKLLVVSVFMSLIEINLSVMTFSVL